MSVYRFIFAKGFAHLAGNFDEQLCQWTLACGS